MASVTLSIKTLEELRNEAKLLQAVAKARAEQWIACEDVSISKNLEIEWTQEFEKAKLATKIAARYAECLGLL